ncbi:leucine-rich repeat-containing protein 56 isoform X2 [Catharus ustulatus]|uniref:Leucine rich repeat containing 56 n=1 Tax=Catharus ustulatus TaxID=91951 RepID=A0A8C3TP21_CATUS|nr:leucine-rich repeat-containing protein 56 isoform X2 [Catharus ustulatus]XP_032918893.1 leucine-rich repeat-containing protein 56 isoform X2 [Catharus ustulatus]XP_032918894.1 leucine-rich repeat-containing protein 56 isoform X2 [Catharus ustulatus]XP_032918896.1 leucine-rich repeat-containing protein 56 isoform X2 [Catharus ustulatus]XP_032918897.1 leucine-rich repeat-containing protein 56 isoform X2 [Catharus ustulatus]
MDLKWNPDRVSHPGSSEDQETDLNWQGNPNPSPLTRDDGELLMDEHLSPRKLKILAGVDDLKQVKVLEMRVDTRDVSLGNFGVHLPNLRELKLNNSLLASVRDLGTSLSHLRILWMARCGLSDLDGISSCSSLKELYIAYNNISDLSQLTWLDHLEVLDLEGNNIEDINQLQFLRLCSKLSHLTVEGNLICLKPTADSAEDPDYNYRAKVKKLIPHLKYLDRIPASQTALLPSKKMHEDSLIIKESIKEGGLAKDISWLDSYLGEVAKQSGCSPKPPTTSRSGNAECSANVGTCSDASLLSGSCSLPDPTVFPDKLFIEDDSSDLTHGVRQIICGNPAKALHERRQKLGSPAVSPLKQSGLMTENLCGSEGGRDLHEEKVSPDLGAQTEQHKGCLQAGQQEQTSQALKENEGEDKDKDFIERVSLDPSSHSSSGLSQAQEGAVFSNTRRYLIPTPPKNPSPASAVDVVARPWKTRNHRGLKIPSQEEARQGTQQPQSKAHKENSAQPLDKEPAPLGPHSTLAASGSQEQHQSVGSTSKQRPIAGPAGVGSSRIRPIMDESPSKEINHQRPAACSSTKALQRFRPMNSAWPLTARSILQPLAGKSTATKTSRNRSLQS